MTNFLSRLARKPRPFDTAVAHEALKEFAHLGGEVADFLSSVAACSPYLKSSLEREIKWVEHALVLSPEQAFAQELDALIALTLEDGAVDELVPALRLAKRRLALWIGLCDIGGVWNLEQATGALSDFADLSVDLLIKQLIKDEIRRKKLPGMHMDDIPNAAGMVVLAMGKMGARELNYSSDIDLICLFDETRYKNNEDEARAAFIRVTRKMALLLSDPAADGYVFRTDLRLRPDASVTPVCLSMAAAESYYESMGRTWERAAYIKARPCAGDLNAGARFLKTLTPFVWRKHLDFAAIQDAHDMRLRIRDHRGLHGAIKIAGHNMKLGAGGIREIEFFTQTRQLIAGGRDPDLRCRETVAGLMELTQKGWISSDVSQELIENYRIYREIEHRLQMVHDAQTHSIPTTHEGVARIAAFCGQSETDFRDQLLARLERVDELTEGFFSPNEAEPTPDISSKAQEIVSHWLDYPSLRSQRAREIFARLRPQIWRELMKAANPDEAFHNFDGFLAGLPSGVQIFALFESNPALVELIVDISSTAPRLAKYLSRNAQVLDAVISRSFWEPWPGGGSLLSDLVKLLSETSDYEDKLNAARRWMKEWHFRIGVHHLRGLSDAFMSGKSYADLAQVVVRVLWDVVQNEFSKRHGAPPGRGGVVVAMGSLGAGRLNAESDLDLIVIYDADGVEMSDGVKPLATRPYFARLTQMMVTALGAQMPQGKLYEVDMRLRPSGRQGPVATSLQSFTDYQENEAWSWEHLALTRAKVIAGDTSLAQEIETFRLDVLKCKGQLDGVKSAVADMIQRLREARPMIVPARSKVDEPPFIHIKYGPGYLMEVDLCGQLFALCAGVAARSTDRQLAFGKKIGVSSGDIEMLTSAYYLLWRVYCVIRLLFDKPLANAIDPLLLGESGCAFLLRETQMPTLKDLSRELEKKTQLVDAFIEHFLMAEKN